MMFALIPPIIVLMYSDFSNIKHLIVSLILFLAANYITKNMFIAMISVLAIGIAKEMHDVFFDMSDLVFDILGIYIGVLLSVKSTLNRH